MKKTGGRMYDSGKQTQAKIIDAAKILFYENGIDETNIATIMRAAKIKRPSFFYYFKDIYAVATVVYGQMLNKHYSFFNELLKPYQLSELERICLIGSSHTRLVLSDVYASRFTSQIIFHNLINYTASRRSILEHIAEQYIPKDKEINVEYFAIQNMALSAHYYKKNAENILTIPIDRLLSLKLDIFLRNLYIPDDECERLKAKVILIEKGICFKAMPYFNMELAER